MKPEEPQEEQEKELPGWAYRIPFFLSKYGTHLLFAVAIVLLAFNGYKWYQRKQAEKLNNAWSELADASGPQTADPPAALNRVISTYDVKQVQAFAYVGLGDFYSETILLGNPADGVRGVKISRQAAEQEAETAYGKVLADYPDQALAVARARLGLGKIYEDEGKWDKAREIYETLAAKASGSNTDFAELAKARLEHLTQWQAPIIKGTSTRVETAPATSSAPATTSAPALGAMIAPPTASTTTPATTPATAPSAAITPSTTRSQ